MEFENGWIDFTIAPLAQAGQSNPSSRHDKQWPILTAGPQRAAAAASGRSDGAIDEDERSRETRTKEMIIMTVFRRFPANRFVRRRVLQRHDLSAAFSWLWIVFGVLLAPNTFGQRPAQPPMSDARFSPGESGYQLIWEDQFEGEALDPKRWEIRGVGPRALGFVSPEAVKVEGGFLKLSAFKKDGRILIGAVGNARPFQGALRLLRMSRRATKVARRLGRVLDSIHGDRKRGRSRRLRRRDRYHGVFQKTRAGHRFPQCALGLWSAPTRQPTACRATEKA